MSAVDTLNVATRDYIDRNAKMLVDNVFQASKLAQTLRDKARKFPGGTKITEHIVFAGAGGGAHIRGKKYNNSERQTDQRLQFDPKFVRVPVVLDQIDIRVLNQGPFKVYDILESKLSNAYLTLGAYMEIGLYLPGSGASFAANINGLAEICNDNSTTSWEGNNYQFYGELDRMDANWGTRIKGNITDVNGPITLEILENSYIGATFGGIEPAIGQTTPKCKSFIKFKFQTQQRFNDTQVPGLNFTGLKFNNATIVDSRYCPGSFVSGLSTVGDPVADYVISSTEDASTPLTAYPTVTGETLFWINTDDAYIHFYVSTDRVFGMGFQDFIPSAESDMLVGAVRLCHQLTSPGPRYHAQVKRILS